LESEEYEQDDNDGHILEIIKDKPDCTVNYVRTKMSENHWCSSVNANNKVKNLIKIGLVEDRKIGNSRHKLRLSDKTQYNRINMELDDIDTMVKIMSEPLQKINQLQQQRSQGGHLTAGMYMQNLVGPYFESMFTMLWKLLALSTIDTQIAKPDSIKLHSKIIDLIAKTTYQPFHELDHKKILDENKDILNRYRQRLLDPGTDKSIANVTMVDHLLRRIDKFKVKFLD
jgi:hypothetical protein